MREDNKNSPLASWYATTAVPAPERAALTYDQDVDVCIVGGGLAGLTTARELARRGWSVVLVEAERIGWGASGRNGGVVSPGFAERWPRIVERVGLARAKTLWALSAEGVDYVSRAIREMEIPGVVPQSGALQVRRYDAGTQPAAEAEAMSDMLGIELEFWPTERVREVLRTDTYYQGIYQPGAFHIHPLNYAIGLAAAAEAAGARIFEGTCAIGLDPVGVRKVIETPKARVRSAHVVLAGGPHLGSLFPYVGGTVLPVATRIAATIPLGERISEAIGTRAAVSDTRRAGHYFRVVGDRLLWGGGISARTTPPRNLAKMMQSDLARVFPQLRDVEMEHAWTGVMAYAVHKMPQLGEIAPGVWLASAFGGHGLNTTAMAGEMLARAIVEGDDRWRLFSPYELVWAGGPAGRVAAQIAFWSMQARDAGAERYFRLRERLKRRGDARAVKRAEIEALRERKAAQRREVAEKRRQAESQQQAAELEAVNGSPGAP